MRINHLAVLLVLIPCGALTAPQRGAAGDMDALLGPATVVDQGRGMTEELRRALAPGEEHGLLGRLEGEWTVVGSAGRDREPVHETARIVRMLGGAWYELRLFSGDELQRVAHLGYDGYRGSYALWEVGRGFTSPQARAGESRENGRELHFWRRYTIRRRGELTEVRERLVLTFESPDEIHWRSFETIGGGEERTQRDVVFARTR